METDNCKSLPQRIIDKINSEANQKKLNPNVTIHDIYYWRVKAINDLLNELTDEYSSELGTPTKIIDINRESFNELIFFGRIIIYEKAKKFVVIDRISQIIIPFGCIIGFNQDDLSTTKIVGGDIKSEWSVSPIVGAGLIGTIAEGISTGGIMAGAAINKEYKQNPYSTFTQNAYGLEIVTNNMQQSSIHIYFDEDLDSLHEFSNILNIILSNEEYKKDTSDKIIKNDTEFGILFTTFYEMEIARLEMENHQEEMEKQKEAEEKRREREANSGCMVTILITVITSLTLTIIC